MEPLERRDLLAVDFNAALTFGDATFDGAQEVTTDAAGNTYVAGSFSGTIDLDPAGPAGTLSGLAQLFVAKYGPAGDLLWARGFGNGSCTAIAVDETGSVYTCGTFGSSEADFDPGPGTFMLDYRNGGIYLSKLDASGDFVWAGAMGGGFHDIAWDMALDDGDIYLTGFFSGAADFDPGDASYVLTSAGPDDAFVAKLDSNGALGWAVTAGSDSTFFQTDVGYAIAVDSANNVIVSGVFHGPCDFDPGAGIELRAPRGATDTFLWKLDGAGQFISVHTLGGTGGVDAVGSRALAIDGAGNLYLAGSFFGEIDFDPGPGAVFPGGDGDMFVARFSPTAELDWVSAAGGDLAAFPTDLAIGQLGELYVTGHFISSALDFDPSEDVLLRASAGDLDGFVWSLDSDGGLRFARTFGGPGQDAGQGIAVDPQGQVLVAGGFRETVDFNPDGVGISRTSAGESDGFVIRFAGAAAVDDAYEVLQNGTLVVDNGPVHELELLVAEGQRFRRRNISTGVDLGLLEGTVPAGPSAAFFTYGPDGHLYASSFDGDEVYRYHGSTGKPIGSFTSGRPLNGPRNLAFGPDGKLYVTNTATDSVLRFDGQTGVFLDEFATGIDGPIGLTFGPDGHLYVSSHYYGNVQTFDRVTGEFIDVFASGGGLDVPQAIAFGPDGNLYVSGQLSHAVHRYDGTTGDFLDTPADAIPNPQGLLFTPDGRLLLATYEDGSVLAFNPITGEPLAKLVDTNQYVASIGIYDPQQLAAGVLSNDSYPQNQPASAVLVAGQGPSHGAVTLNPDGTFTYVPEPGFVGSDSFRYVVRQGMSDSLPATVTISVKAPVFAPRARPGGLYQVNEGSAVAINASGTWDPDEPNANLTFHWDLDGDGVFGETGVDATRGTEVGQRSVFLAAALDGPTSVSISLRVTDQDGLIDTATTIVTVLNVPPRVQILAPPTALTGTPIELTSVVTDQATADALNRAWTVRFNGTVVASGSEENLTFTPQREGSYLVSLRASDDDGGARTAQARIVVSQVDAIGLFAPSSSFFFLRNQQAGGAADLSFGYGPPEAGWTALAGDWDSDGRDSVGLYNSVTGTFFLRDANGGGAADIVFQFGPGGRGLLPVVGHWNGRGRDTIGLFDPGSGTFFLKNNHAGGAADIVVQYGPAGGGWTPITGDWDGDGTSTVGLFDPASNTFFLRNEHAPGPADRRYQYGASGAGWLPLAGDWNGDGADTPGLYASSTSTFFLRNEHSAGPADVTFAYGPAGAGWLPLVGSWGSIDDRVLKDAGGPATALLGIPSHPMASANHSAKGASTGAPLLASPQQHLLVTQVQPEPGSSILVGTLSHSSRPAELDKLFASDELLSELLQF